ncbi:MAG TPA: orotate phosphoribosyltransferase [bacterium (Candidatus Stahlbacteria)]|nr:orotate phosphoribosyltransferase [Candidatus Stahlbacteria bacterium]
MDFKKIFKDIGMIMEGHFELASGLHSSIYFEKFRLLEHPEYTKAVCQEIANHFKHMEVKTVAGPTTGGIIIAYEVAKQLGKRCIFAERTQEGRDFLRGFKIEGGEKILVVDDVLTTGGSITDVINAIKARNGIVVGVGVVVDRSEGVDFGVPLFSVYKTRVKNFTPQDCPLCREGVSLTKPGGLKKPASK